jgi:hypothetical protein
LQRAAVQAAAERAGMALSAWVGVLCIDAAEHKTLPVGWLHREMITELIWLRGRMRPACRREPSGREAPCGRFA